ncbi:hypothetical protein [Streptomyces wuyuanensis]|uniref:hypothetical protein n=1 Tax=Streptomyces wuyuanensis TaxID=1196353 RepID=UPI0037A07DCF
MSWLTEIMFPQRTQLRLSTEHYAAKAAEHDRRLADQLLDAVGHNAQALTPEQRRALGLPAGGAR